MSSNSKHIAIYNQKPASGDVGTPEEQNRIIIEIGGNKCGPTLSNKEVDMILASVNAANAASETVSVVSPNSNSCCPPIGGPNANFTTQANSNLWPSHPPVYTHNTSIPSNVTFNKVDNTNSQPFGSPIANPGQIFSPFIPDSNTFSRMSVLQNIPLNGNVRVVLQGNQMQAISDPPCPPCGQSDQNSPNQLLHTKPNGIPVATQINMPNFQGNIGMKRLAFSGNPPLGSMSYQANAPPPMGGASPGCMPCGTAFVPVKVLYNPLVGYQFVPDYVDMNRGKRNTSQSCRPASTRKQCRPQKCCCCNCESSVDDSETDSFYCHDPSSS